MNREHGTVMCSIALCMYYLNKYFLKNIFKITNSVRIIETKVLCLQRVEEMDSKMLSSLLGCKWMQICLKYNLFFFTFRYKWISAICFNYMLIELNECIYISDKYDKQ